MPELTTEQVRAAMLERNAGFARVALQAVRGADEIDDETDPGDLVVALLCYCTSTGRDPSDMIETAWMHYEREITSPDDLAEATAAEYLLNRD